MEQLSPIYGEDPIFLSAVEAVSRLAELDRPCLVVGERGTGKELLTSRLHYLSPRWQGPLVKVNCAALSGSLLDSELFGHEAGAFTGAQRRHIGRFERAQGGTLVLDEIATASVTVQEKVLRIVEYGEFERLGGRETIALDVRVVGATNVDLPAFAREGKFRADLLDRLAFEVVTIPPLRVRPVDILALANEFGLAMTRVLAREVFPGFSKAAEATLVAHDWPGNVRELKNVVERAVWRASALDDSIDEVAIDPFQSPWSPGAGAMPDHGVEPGPSPDRETDARGGFTERVAAFERSILSDAWAHAHYNQTEAARRLELSYHQFRRLIAKHGLRR